MNDPEPQVPESTNRGTAGPAHIPIRHGGKWGKLSTLALMALGAPARLFTNISPLTLIRDSKLSRKCAILSGTRIHSSAIDDYSYVGRNCLITDTEIGRFCSIADDCKIGLNTHPTQWVSTSFVFHAGTNNLGTNFAQKTYHLSSRTVIEHDVWIGVNVCVTGGVTIGTGAIVGAGAIATKDVEPYAIVVGNPGRVIRHRFSAEQCDSLLRSEWWNLPRSELLALAEYINDVQAFIERLPEPKT